jgi:hypothetical protein
MTEWGKKLLAGTWWDAGMRGFFTRVSTSGGPEDMEYAVAGIEGEAREDERARILAAVKRLDWLGCGGWGCTSNMSDTYAAVIAAIKGEA